MAIQFAPSSIKFVKSKAKQLQRAFPGLQLSKAQEATAIALGYKSFFDLKSRLDGSSDGTSIYSEDLTTVDRLTRRHHQFCALVDTAKLPANLVAYFIRVWNLTSRAPASNLDDFDHPYARMFYFANHPDRTDDDDGEDAIIRDGVCCGTSGGYNRHSYFALDCINYHKLPPYFRSTTSTFLTFEDGKSLPLLFGEHDEGNNGLEELCQNHWHAEWFNGSTNKRETSLASFRQDAINHPNDWFALSVRTTDLSATDRSIYIPALRGDKFVEFIDSKGDFSVSDVKWFAAKIKDHHALFQTKILTIGKLRIDQSKVTPISPIYHYPFKFKPMGLLEYVTSIESNSFRVDEELEDDIDC